MIPRKLPNRPIAIGTDVETGEPMNIGLHRLSEHLSCFGPTGAGKSRGFMLPLWEQLVRMPDISVIAMTCKGDYCDNCADFAIAHGLAKDLVVFKAGNGVGFNPLRKSAMPPERHAKLARTAFLASHGEHSIDQMPQLARLTFLALAVSLEQGLSLPQAARLLRPGRSPFRTNLIHTVQSEFLRESLSWFNDLQHGRQDELAASTLARLESLVSDPAVERILTETECCFDPGNIVKKNMKACVDFSFFNPLVPDDARTMLRFTLNTILAHKFATPKEERTITVLLLDEAPQYSTLDLAAALELGRELKLYCVLAGQFPGQYKINKDDTRLYAAVEQCTRTKVVFGGMAVADLKPLIEETRIGEYDPMRIKHRTTVLELDPIESARESVTRGGSAGTSFAATHSRSASTARGATRGTSKQWGASHAHSDAWSVIHGTGQSTGKSSGIVNGETTLPNGDFIAIANATEGASEIDTSIHTESNTAVDSFGQFQSDGIQQAISMTETSGSGSGFSSGVNTTRTQSTTMAPFYEYRKRRNVSGVTFQTLEEFLTISLQRTKAQPKAHFMIKTPDHNAVFVRAHFVREPWIPNALRTRALERMHGLLVRAANQKAIIPPQPYQLAPAAVELRGQAPGDDWE